MQKTILVTGATDGIGFATAQKLAELGHHVLIHGRSSEKLEATKKKLSSAKGDIEAFKADLSRMAEVGALADEIAAYLSKTSTRLDVLINNAGVFKTPETLTADGRDMRFVVNTLAPWLLTQRLLPLLGQSGRVINLSSAAQAPINFDALTGKNQLADFDAYAQSKLALTLWSHGLAKKLGKDGPVIVAVNPGSLLATKMVKEAFGSSRDDVGKGADILVSAALDDEFSNATGKYFDNDAGAFGPPHEDALNSGKYKQLVETMEALLAG